MPIGYCRYARVSACLFVVLLTGVAPVHADRREGSRHTDTQSSR